MTRSTSCLNKAYPLSVLPDLALRAFLLIVLMTLSACSKDKDFNTDKKTADFTEQNFEESAMGVLQTALLAPVHTPFFAVLDELDLPDNSVWNDDSQVYVSACALSGTASFSFQPVTGSTHPVGNKVQVHYDNCDQGNGYIYVGRAEFTDTKFEGLARNLTLNDTQQCINSVAKKVEELRSRQGRGLESINTYTLQGLELTFIRSGDSLVARVHRMEPDSFGDPELVVRDLLTIGRDETAIIVLQDTEVVEPYLLTTDGDRVYSVIDRMGKLELCQSMHRTLSAKLTDFGFLRADFNAYFNGTITLLSSTEDFQNYSGSIADSSDYSVRVEQGNSRKTYYFEDVVAVQTYSSLHQSFGYRIGGFMNIDGVGVVSLFSRSTFYGRRDNPYFREGMLEATGYDLDTIRLTGQDEYLLKIQLAPEGSPIGISLPTYTLSMDIPWMDLLAREFRYAESTD